MARLCFKRLKRQVTTPYFASYNYFSTLQTVNQNLSYYHIKCNTVVQVTQMSKIRVASQITKRIYASV